MMLDIYNLFIPALAAFMRRLCLIDYTTLAGW